ncbi:FAD/NAD(P)-binding domain [Dillenia turbinata]|uniref:FAD/NAD(P)-binding domain n=1 Tax=Dillenia turbinata TaxID=194707 RepID=A0AAN8VMU2_9MAGN
MFQRFKDATCISNIKNVNQMSFWSRGISVTSQHQSATVEMVVEKSESEDDFSSFPGLEATRPGEKPVVVGTRWGACRFLKGMDTKIYDVVCFSPRNHMAFTPLLTSTCVGTQEFRSVAESVGQMLSALTQSPNSFYLANCIGLDTGKHEVYCEMVGEGELRHEPCNFKVAYGKLVIATGADPLTFNIKGVKENAFFPRKVNHAQRISKKLLLNLMLSQNPGCRKTTEV